MIVSSVSLSVPPGLQQPGESSDVLIQTASGDDGDLSVDVEEIMPRGLNLLHMPKMDICHKGRTINIAASLLPAHLNHGDTLGACPAN